MWGRHAHMSVDMFFHIWYIFHVCVCSVRGGVWARVENFWWHTQCTQLCSRCTLQSHVWLPFVVFTDGEHQHPSHPTLLTSGLPDPSVCLLINQSEDHVIYSWLIRNKRVVKAQKEYISPLKTDLSKSTSHKDVFKWHLLPISAIKCSILQNKHISVYSRCAVCIQVHFIPQENTQRHLLSHIQLHKLRPYLHLLQ